MVTGVVPSSSRCLPSIFIAHRVQQSHCSSIFHRVLLIHALALSATQFVHEKKFPRIHASMHSWGLELAKLTYTRLEDKLIFFLRTFLLSSFWTSRSHRCRPFPPPVLPSIFIAYRVQQSHCSSISRFIRLYTRGIRTHKTDLYQARG